MPKPIIIIAGVAAVAVIGAGTFFVVQQNNKSSTSDGSTSSQSSTTKDVAVVDPDGTYNFFSDPSVTKYPEKNVVFGNGQTLSFEYDGSKTNNDSYATLSYQLYYVQDDGKVQPMGGGNMNGTGGKGTFTTSDSVFESNAKDRKGFFELQGTYDTSFDENYKVTGKNVKLGMYPIKFEISE